MPGTATRNETTNLKQESQQTTQTRQTGGAGSEGRAERERGLRDGVEEAT